MNDKVLKYVRSFLILFLFFNSSLFQYIPFLLFHKDISYYSTDTYLGVLLLTYSYLILFAILLVFYRMDIFMEFKTFIKKLRENIDTGFGCWIVGLIIMFFANSILVSVFKSGGANNEIMVRSFVDLHPILMGINVCFLAPIIEEFVFRKTLKDVISKPKIYIFASFLLFGFAHVYGMANTYTDWLYMVPYGALGGAFALAYSKTNTIFTSMFFHMFHNTFVFFLILFFI